MLSNSGFVKAREYSSKRLNLVSGEKRYRTDYVFVGELSPTAQAASTIVSRIRQFERQNLLYSRGRTSYFTPGTSFTHVKESFAENALFEIIKKLPKGAILHAHHAACVSVDFIIEKLIETPGMYISATRPLDTWWAKREKRIKVTFVYNSSQPRSTRSAVKTLWDPEYQPNSLVPVSLAASTYKTSGPVHESYYGPHRAESSAPAGKTFFITWLKNRLKDPETQRSNVSAGINEAWNTFPTGIRLLNTMIHNEPVFRPFLRRLFEGLPEDNVKWIELRMTFKVGFQLEGSDTVSGEIEMARVVFEEREKFANTMKKKGKEWWGMRIIWTSLRIWKDEDIKADMENCMCAKERYPDLISGYDIVGQEELGRTLEDLAPVMLWFQDQCKCRNLNIPFFFHAGKCLGTGDATDNNLYDALALGTRRIAHGYSLPKHPWLQEDCKRRQILIESCPISHNSSKLTHSTSAHTLPMLLANRVSASLNGDDKYLVGSELMGVSMEFFMCIWSFENLGLGGLGHLAENSVRWSQFEDQSDKDWKLGIQEGEILETGLKGKRMREWRKDWEIFCAWIVENYGEPWGNEEAYRVILKEREELEKKHEEEREREEREWLDGLDERFKKKKERMVELEEKTKRRKKVTKRAKELMAEEEVQTDMEV